METTTFFVKQYAVRKAKMWRFAVRRLDIYSTQYEGVCFTILISDCF